MTTEASGPSASPGLYIHVPFCARVCPYCDFAVQTGGPLRRQAFVQSLLREIKLWSGLVRGEEIPAARCSSRDGDPTPIAWLSEQSFNTVYLGGGTPSSLPAEVLDEILAALRRYLPITEDADVTLEANPEDVSARSLDAWRTLGVTSLSLGIQTFDADGLHFLGRAHTPDSAGGALRAALAASFETVSIDLIFALPGQSEELWRADLEQAIDFGPDHISCYELTIHEGTRFGRRKDQGSLEEVAEDDRAELFFLAHRLLAGGGFQAYEVSNFARDPAHRSRHNRKYWNHSAYLGLGPSAHSFDGVETRWWNERRLRAWEAGLEASPCGVREESRRDSREDSRETGSDFVPKPSHTSGRSPIAGFEKLGPADLVLESLALGLRTTAGVDLDALQARYGIDVAASNSDQIGRLRRDGFLAEIEPVNSLVPTLRGLAVADAIARSLEISD